MTLNNLNKFAKKAREEAALNKIIEEKEEKKINWKKLIYAIWKIVEPEIKKLPKIYILFPITFAVFFSIGLYRSIEIIVNLFIK